MQKFSLHMHTVGFDGKNTETEMLEKAMECQLKQIGFSNHFIVHPNIKKSPMYAYASRGGYSDIYSSDFDEVIRKFENHYRKIDELKKVSDIMIFKGMEVDYFPDDEWRKGFERAIKILQPDYLIGTTHFVEDNGILLNSHDLKNSPKIKQNKFLHRYWQGIRAAAQSRLFDFIAHLDLMKKVGLGHEEVWREDELKTVKTLKANSIATEINTSGFKFNYNEAYPSRRMMKMLAEYNIPVLLSDDAHKKENITCKFAKAEQIAKECGIVNFLTPQFLKANPHTYGSPILGYNR